MPKRRKTEEVEAFAAVAGKECLFGHRLDTSTATWACARCAGTTQKANAAAFYMP